VRKNKQRKNLTKDDADCWKLSFLYPSRAAEEQLLQTLYKRVLLTKEALGWQRVCKHTHTCLDACALSLPCPLQLAGRSSQPPWHFFFWTKRGRGDGPSCCASEFEPGLWLPCQHYIRKHLLLTLMVFFIVPREAARALPPTLPAFSDLHA